MTTTNLIWIPLLEAFGNHVKETFGEGINVEIKGLRKPWATIVEIKDSIEDDEEGLREEDEPDADDVFIHD